jgi:hypothetical protein
VDNGGKEREKKKRKWGNREKHIVLSSESAGQNKEK